MCARAYEASHTHTHTHTHTHMIHTKYACTHDANSSTKCVLAYVNTQRTQTAMCGVHRLQTYQIATLKAVDLLLEALPACGTTRAAACSSHFTAAGCPGNTDALTSTMQYRTYGTNRFGALHVRHCSWPGWGQPRCTSCQAPLDSMSATVRCGPYCSQRREKLPSEYGT